MVYNNPLQQRVSGCAYHMKIEKNGLQSSILALNKFRKVAKNPDKVLDKLSEIGKKSIEEAHRGTMGIDHVIAKGNSQDIEITSDAIVTVESGIGSRTITASGENFLFFEFGAGVKHNSPRSWENVLNVPVPDGISPIGQYKAKRGSRPSWRYKGEDGKTVITGGYPAVHGFATAINEIVANTSKVIKEVQNE